MALTIALSTILATTALHTGSSCSAAKKNTTLQTPPTRSRSLCSARETGKLPFPLGVLIPLPCQDMHPYWLASIVGDAFAVALSYRACRCTRMFPDDRDPTFSVVVAEVHKTLFEQWVNEV